MQDIETNAVATAPVIDPVDTPGAPVDQDMPMQENRSLGRRAWRRLHLPRFLPLRRLIGIVLMAALAGSIYWATFHTELLTPLLALIGPVQDGIDWVLADPQRAWMGLAAIIIPHLGMYFLIFEDRR